mmetsp:Transcript_166867/g.320497  ORF Transcript_166867/g.320497 Transcript_166867/m.320497 type:complete len:547 (+) Transcript_166867:54-1694(+)
MEVGTSEDLQKDQQVVHLAPDALPVITWQPLPWPPNLVQFGDFQGNAKWSAGVLGADGETIFCVPSDSESVLAFSTRTRETELFGRFPQMSKWSGAVLAADKRTVFGIPASARSVLAVDTGLRTAETFGELDPTFAKYSGGVLGPDNVTIFCIPSCAESVLAINTITRDLRSIGELAGGFVAGRKWAGGVLSGDKIFGIPCDSTQVLVIDPASQSVDYFGDFPAGDSKWSGGVLGPDNITIFAIPLNSETVLAINTRDRTTLTFGALPGQRKWRGGVLGPDNETIFAMPSNSDQVLAINTTDYTVKTFGFAGYPSWKWSCGVLGDDRSTIFGVPLNSPTFLAVEVGELVTGDPGLISNTKETESSVSSDCTLRSFSKESVKRASVTRRESLMKQRASLPDLHHQRSGAGPEEFKLHRISVSAGSCRSLLPNIEEGLMIDKKTRRFSQPVQRLPPAVEQYFTDASQVGVPRSDAKAQPRRPGSAGKAVPINRRHTTLGHTAGNFLANPIPASGAQYGSAHRGQHRPSLHASSSEPRLGSKHRFSQLL